MEHTSLRGSGAICSQVHLQTSRESNAASKGPLWTGRVCGVRGGVPPRQFGNAGRREPPVVCLCRGGRSSWVGAGTARERLESPSRDLHQPMSIVSFRPSAHSRKETKRVKRVKRRARRHVACAGGDGAEQTGRVGEGSNGSSRANSGTQKRAPLLDRFHDLLLTFYWPFISLFIGRVLFF